MNVEIRNVKVAAFASQETTCFEASVYIDGKKVGTVSNDGHGGCHSYHPTALYLTLTEWAKTLSPWKDVNGDWHEYDADMAICDQVDDVLVRRDLDRKLKGHVVLKKDDGHIYTAKVPKGADVRAAAERHATRPGVVKVLNLLSAEEALAEWRSAS